MSTELPPQRSFGTLGLLLLLIVAVGVEIVARSMGGPGPTRVLAHSSFALIGAASIYIAFCAAILDPVQRGHARCLGFAVMAIAVAAVCLGVRIQPIMLVLAAPFGVLGTAGFIAAWVLNRGTERRRWGQRFAEALAIPLTSTVGPFGMWLSGRNNPVYDLHLFAVDETLGFRPTALATDFVAAVPPAEVILTTAYVTITLVAGAVHACQRSRRHPVDLVVAFTVAGLVGFALYFALPGIGPFYTLADYYGGVPPALGDVLATPFDAAAIRPRNAMPSLHTAWALLLWFCARSFAPGWRIALRVFAALNLLATVGLGEHWIVDLVVAVPMAVAVQAACAVDADAAARRRAVLWGAFLTLAWFAALRWAMPVLAVPGMAWVAMPATVLWALWLERRVFATATAAPRAATEAVPARA